MLTGIYIYHPMPHWRFSGADPATGMMDFMESRRARLSVDPPSGAMSGDAVQEVMPKHNSWGIPAPRCICHTPIMKRRLGTAPGCGTVLSPGDHRYGPLSEARKAHSGQQHMVFQKARADRGPQVMVYSAVRPGRIPSEEGGGDLRSRRGTHSPCDALSGWPSLGSSDAWPITLHGNT